MNALRAAMHKFTRRPGKVRAIARLGKRALLLAANLERRWIHSRNFGRVIAPFCRCKWKLQEVVRALAKFFISATEERTR